MNPFFTIHSGLEREGPGSPGDVLWALDVAGVPGGAAICDAACGPGADTVTLAEARPAARIEAIDKQAHFVAEAQARLARFGDRVTVRRGDMADLSGPCDFIWCAGALYFLGVTEGLRGWRAALAPGGHIAFSEPCLLGESAAARTFWADYPAIGDLDGIVGRARAAGFRTLDSRTIVGDGWARYYAPMEARIADLRADRPDAALGAAIREAEAEIAAWRAAPDDIAYALLVVAPA